MRQYQMRDIDTSVLWTYFSWTILLMKRLISYISFIYFFPVVPVSTISITRRFVAVVANKRDSHSKFLSVN